MTSAFSQSTFGDASKRDCAAESRSTSARSNEGGELMRLSSGRSLTSRNSGLPDYEYPVAVIVRNTFIETHVARDLSLEEFFEERRIQSCPMPSPDDEFTQAKDPESARLPQPLHRAITTGAHALMSSVAAAAGFWTRADYETPALPIENPNNSQPMPRVLMLSEALHEPSLGSYEMPTVGSAGHNMGVCKPCAFFHTRGCENGVQCSFCHLCAPDEKRKRQKEKQSMFRGMRQQQRRQVQL